MISGTIDNVQPLAVCLHASAGSHRQWLPLCKMLERHVRTVTPDLVGYGDATPFVRGRRFMLEREVASHMAPCTDPGRINPLIAGHLFETLRQGYRLAA